MLCLTKDFRGALENLRTKGLVLNIRDELSRDHEYAAFTAALEDKKVLVFENIRESPFKVVSGIYGNRERLAISLGITVGELRKRFIDAMDRLGETVLVGNAPVHENTITGENLDVGLLPIPKIYEKDAGYYLTSSIIIAKDPETRTPNASYHRMLKLSKNKFAVRVVKRDLWHYLRKAKEMGRKLEAAVVIGVDPGTALAASTTIEIDKNELELASAINGEPLEITKGKFVDVEYPANAEIVMEGYLNPFETHEEGPFVDITGSYDKVRNEPVFEVKSLSYRNNPYFHFILSGGHEHVTLMGFPKEAKIYKYVSSVTPVKDVLLTKAGTGWFESVISIRKRHKDEPIDAGLAAFAAHTSMKKVIVVDEDIDITNYEEVHWAVLTRANPATDYIIIPRSKGSSLDKSSETKSKIIIDATIKGNPLEFEKGRIPTSERVKDLIGKYSKTV